jgi:hypothetical protein
MGRVLVEVVPAVQQQLDGETALQVPKPMVLVDTCFVGYGPPGGSLMVVRADSVRHQLPVGATYFRHVLPHVRGFPTLRVLCVIRRPIGIRGAFPVTGLLRLPAVPGAEGASQVLRRLFSCMPRPVDAGGPAPPRPIGGARMAFGSVQTLGVRNIRFSKLYQHFRVRGHPYGLQDTLSTPRPSCSSGSRPRLRHGRKTRYGWVANLYPTGTFTLQETPSCLGARTPAVSGGENALAFCPSAPLACSALPCIPPAPLWSPGACPLSYATGRISHR